MPSRLCGGDRFPEFFPKRFTQRSDRASATVSAVRRRPTPASPHSPSYRCVNATMWESELFDPSSQPAGAACRSCMVPVPRSKIRNATKLEKKKLQCSRRLRKNGGRTQSSHPRGQRHHCWLPAGPVTLYSGRKCRGHCRVIQLSANNWDACEATFFGREIWPHGEAVVCVGLYKVQKLL